MKRNRSKVIRTAMRNMPDSHDPGDFGVDFLVVVVTIILEHVWDASLPSANTS